MGLRFSTGTNVTEVLERLCQYTLAHPGQFDVFTTESFFTDPVTSLVDLSAFSHSNTGAGIVEPMPERYHFSANYRIAPVWIVPRVDYALTNRKDGEEGMSTGVSFTGPPDCSALTRCPLHRIMGTTTKNSPCVPSS